MRRDGIQVVFGVQSRSITEEEEERQKEIEGTLDGKPEVPSWKAVIGLKTQKKVISSTH